MNQINCFTLTFEAHRVVIVNIGCDVNSIETTQERYPELQYLLYTTVEGVGTATGYGLEGPSSIYGRSEFFLFSLSYQTGSRTPPDSYPNFTGGSFPWG
jgi:hypothetical protein